MRALLTGFEGFASKINTSGMIAKYFDGKHIGRLEISGRVLPEDFYTLPGIVGGLVRKLKPDIIISTGWDYVSKIKVEKISLNVMNSLFGEEIVPDNAGNSPIGEQIIRKGPLALRATFPAEQISKVLSKAKVPVELSYYAGTHCCNTVMYSALYHSQQLQSGILCGFMHLPPIPEMNVKRKGTKAMSFSRERDAVEDALVACSKKMSKRKT